MRLFLCCIAAIAPMALKRLIYRLLRWDVDDSARVGFSLLHCRYVQLGKGTRIGHGNFFKNLDEVIMGEDCYVRHFNQFFAQTDTARVVRRVRFGQRSQVMSRHFFDCAGALAFGDDVVVGGRDSQFWTHSLVRADGIDEFRIGQISVGDGSYIGARAILVECAIAKGSVVAAGAVVAGSAGREGDRSGLLYRGNPAKTVPLRR